MKNITQLHNTTPEELAKKIEKILKEEVDDLKKNFQPKEPTQLVTRKGAAELFAVDISTIHNWTVKGKLKAYGIGSRVYYKRSEIEEALIRINS